MGDRHQSVTDSRRQRARRAQQMTLVHGVMACVFFLLLIQLFLLMVAVEAYLDGRREVLLPATLASGVCFAGSCWAIRYITVRRLS